MSNSLTTTNNTFPRLLKAIISTRRAIKSAKDATTNTYKTTVNTVNAARKANLS